METNELPEDKRKEFCLWYYAQPQPLDANKVFDRLGLQSKEEEIAVQNSAIYSLQTNLTAVTNELDRWKLKYGALATGYEMKVKALEEELKAKEKEAESLVNEVNTIADHANKLWEGNFRVLEEQLKAKDEEIAKLKAERESRAEHKRLNDEIAQLTKPKDELSKEVERLRGLLSKCQIYLWHDFGAGGPDNTELKHEILSLLSQSTDKQDKP